MGDGHRLRENRVSCGSASFMDFVVSIGPTHCIMKKSYLLHGKSGNSWDEIRMSQLWDHDTPKCVCNGCLSDNQQRK